MDKRFLFVGAVAVFTTGLLTGDNGMLPAALVLMWMGIAVKKTQ